MRYMAYDAVARPDGSYAYRLRASLDQAQGPRIGLKGTAKLQGERVPLAYGSCASPGRPSASSWRYDPGHALPPLRDELDLLPGPALPDGQPSWTLHDPVRNLFFQIDWASFEILQRWRLRWPGVIARRIRPRPRCAPNRTMSRPCTASWRSTSCCSRPR